MFIIKGQCQKGWLDDIIGVTWLAGLKEQCHKGWLDDIIGVTWLAGLQ